MEIQESQKFVVTLSYEELRGIEKLIGSTSKDSREAVGLTEKESISLAKIYDYLDKYFENS